MECGSFKSYVSCAGQDMTILDDFQVGASGVIAFASYRVAYPALT